VGFAERRQGILREDYSFSREEDLIEKKLFLEFFSNEYYNTKLAK
jgi:hypothetical protein